MVWRFRLILSVQIHDFGHNHLRKISSIIWCSLPMWRIVQRTARLKIQTVFFLGVHRNEDWNRYHQMLLKLNGLNKVTQTQLCVLIRSDLINIIKKIRRSNEAYDKIQSQSLCLGFTLSVAMEGKGEKGEVDKLKGALNGRPMPVTWLNGISQDCGNNPKKKNSEDECWQRVLGNLEATELSGCAVTCQSTLVMLVTSFRGETAERRILETYNKKILVPYQNLSELNVQRFCESSGFVATFVFPSCVIFIWRNVTPRSKGCFKWVHCTP